MPIGTITPIATVLHSTLTQSRKKLVLASMKSNALMAWVFAGERVELEGGGYNVTNPLTLGRNPNVASYSYFQTLPVAQTNEFETVEYGWSRVAGSVIISDQEEDENKGEVAIFKLMDKKMEVLEESIKERFSQFMYAAGGGTDPLGLASLIPANPLLGTLGGLSRVTESQWRTSAYVFGGAIDATNIEEAFDDVLLDLKLKGDKPDVIIIGRNLYRTYRQAVRDKIVINLQDTGNGKKMFDLGFEGISHNGVPILYDEDCPVSTAYFINSKYLRLHVLKHVNMKPKQLVAPWNTDAVGSRVVWQGQWCLWRAFRTHAYVSN
jgi:hypothetical protein